MSHEESLALAALLHDIGTFWQRTSHRREEETRDHACLSGQFIERCFGEQWSESARIASSHHQPQDLLSKLLLLADGLSLSRERHEDTTTPEARQLASAFSRLAGGSGSPHRFPLRPLAADRDTLFPRQSLDANPRASYAALWDAFAAEAKAVSGLRWTDPAGLVDTVYNLLFKYTWCVPADAECDAPDVSLFDHLRTTAAIALGLYRSGISEADVDALLSGSAADTPRLSLIAGDVCGVRHFVYAQSSKGDASTLRGRAFYVELLTEVAARWVLRQLGLRAPNLLYCGGGRFYLLAQIVDDDTLSSLRQQLSRAVLEHNRGELSIALASYALRPHDVEEFAESRSIVDERLDRAKRRRFSDLPPSELHELVFKPGGADARAGTCAVCGAADARHPLGDGASSECGMCNSLRGLGRQLADAEYLFIVPADDGQPRAHLQEWQRLLYFGLGYLVNLIGEPLEANLRATGAGATVTRLDSAEFVTRDSLQAFRPPRNPPAFGFRFLATATPRKRENPAAAATFDDLAVASEGAPLVGALCLDVDDVGWLFSSGLGADASMSRVCSVSLLLRLFFDVWLSGLSARWNPGGEKGTDGVQCVYAGGDDAFIIGGWSDIAELAPSAQRDFAAFTCHNASIGISAGTMIAPPRFPICQLARAAWESLERGAKRHPGKNAVDFMGGTFAWPDFEGLRRWRGVLQDAIFGDGRRAGGKAPRSLLLLLTELYQEYLWEQAIAPEQRLFRGPTVHYGPWMWKAAYHLSRIIQGLSGSTQSELGQVREALMDAERLPRELPRLALAARWVELLSHTEGSKHA